MGRGRTRSSHGIARTTRQTGGSGLHRHSSSSDSTSGDGSHRYERSRLRAVTLFTPFRFNASIVGETRV